MDISRVKPNLGRKVRYNGKEYILSGCILRVNEKGFYYQAEIQNLTAYHSVVICKLEDLEEL